MSLSPQDALIHIMVATGASDAAISDDELTRIGGLLGRLPAFDGYDTSRLIHVANQCIDAINGPGGIDGALDSAVAAIPSRLHDTAYAVAVEVAVVDLQLPQEELRLPEMIRDRLDTDRLTTAAIEAAARARMRRL